VDETMLYVHQAESTGVTKPKAITDENLTILVR
jgi:hypothetical protein